MQIRDLKDKSEQELQTLLKQQREVLRDLRFRASHRQLKNVREIRGVRTGIAQILTILNKNTDNTDKINKKNNGKAKAGKK